MHDAECIKVVHAATYVSLHSARPGNLGFPASPPIERDSKVWRCTCHDCHDCHMKRSRISVYTSLDLEM